MFRPRVEIRIFRNRFQLTDEKTGRTIERAAVTPFSSDRMLVADHGVASKLLADLIVELEGRRRLVAWPIAVVHPKELCDDGLCPAEEFVLREMMDALGFAKVEFAR